MATGRRFNAIASRARLPRSRDDSCNKLSGAVRLTLLRAAEERRCLTLPVRKARDDDRRASKRYTQLLSRRGGAAGVPRMRYLLRVGAFGPIL